MRLFDLHCDTLTECCRQNISMYDNDMTAITLSGRKNYIQSFALYTDYTLPKSSLREFFIRNFEYLEAEAKAIDNFRIIEDEMPDDTSNGIYAIRTVESARVLYDLSNFDLFLKYKIKVASLTHNEENELAGGAHSTGGMTELGYRVIDLFLDNDIAVDISHLNDKSCDELLLYTDKSVIATHSSARAVRDCKRNMTDSVFKEIVSRGGIVGINIHAPFLSNKEPTVDDIVKHIYHFLTLSGENTVALGCDMDGALMPAEIKNLDGLENLYEYMLKLNFSEQITDRIFYKNAYDYFAKRRFSDDI